MRLIMQTLVYPYIIGTLVTATTTVTEGGQGYIGNPDVTSMFDKTFIHAYKGEEGLIVHVGGNGIPTVLFTRTGTATIVGEDEIKVSAQVY